MTESMKRHMAVMPSLKEAVAQGGPTPSVQAPKGIPECLGSKCLYKKGAPCTHAVRGVCALSGRAVHVLA